jgi:competence protein ComEA
MGKAVAPKKGERFFRPIFWRKARSIMINTIYEPGGIMKQAKRTISVVILVAFAIVFAGTCCASAMEKVNINTATAAELTTLERVGAKYAQRIIDYRETVGPFEKPEDIMKVKGIGEKTWAANKDRIVV